MGKFAKYALCLWGALLSSCAPHTDFSTIPPKDIEKTNRVRERIGIRVIQSTWAFYGSEFGADKWENGGVGFCKCVQKNANNSIDWEEDYYYSGRSVTDPEKGKTWESLTVHYDYSVSRVFISYCGDNSRLQALTHTLRSDKAGWIGTSDAETLKVADSILAMWGLSRL